MLMMEPLSLPLQGAGGGGILPPPPPPSLLESTRGCLRAAPKAPLALLLGPQIQ